MDIRQQVRTIIAEQLEVPEDKVTSDVDFRTLQNFDSMRVLQIILKTEKAFDIEIDAAVTFQVTTVGQFQDVVEERCAQRTSAS